MSLYRNNSGVRFPYSLFTALGGPLVSRLGGPRKVVRAVDERDVREGLREVSDLPPRVHVVLFREQSHVVADREQPLEQAARLVHAPGQDVRIHEPEATR